MSLVSTADKVACLRRELALRRNVYAHRVKRRLMDPAQADREIEVMAEILADYESVQADNEAQQ